MKIVNIEDFRKDKGQSQSLRGIIGPEYYASEAEKLQSLLNEPEPTPEDLAQIPASWLHRAIPKA